MTHEDGGAAIVIDFIGGNCPVQAQGTIDGKRFYFRSRGEHWSVEISPGASGLYMTWPDDDPAWVYEEEWGGGEFAAGWMPEDAAVSMIGKAAKLYVIEKQMRRRGHD